MTDASDTLDAIDALLDAHTSKVAAVGLTVSAARQDCVALQAHLDAMTARDDVAMVTLNAIIEKALADAAQARANTIARLRRVRELNRNLATKNNRLRSEAAGATKHMNAQIKAAL